MSNNNNNHPHHLPSLNGPNSLITQVAPPPSSDPSSLITQVAPPLNGSTPPHKLPSINLAAEKAKHEQAISIPPTSIAPPTSTPILSSSSESTKVSSTNNSTAATNSPKPSLFSSLFCCFGRSGGDGKANDMSTKNDSGQRGATNRGNSTAGNKPKDDKKYLLRPLLSEDQGKKCLVLDLDETLVHSSFKPVAHADFVIPVEIDNQIHNVYVLKRPGVDLFLQRLGSQFEVVVFTASLAKYADPVLDVLDKYKVVKHRLFREACLHYKGNYVKDLSLLGRELKDVIIIDNSPASYIFHPTNAIPIGSWFNDPNDTELMDLVPFLEDLKMVENVMVVLDNSNEE